MSSNYKFKSDTIENDYGVFSIEETMQLNDKRRISRINSSSLSSNNSLSGRRSSMSNSSNISEVAPAIKSTSHHFRMIVCGDSGIGKSALVQALSSSSSTTTTTTSHTSFEPVEVFNKENSDTCIVDTCGYGALLRVCKYKNVIIFIYTALSPSYLFRLR